MQSVQSAPCSSCPAGQPPDDTHEPPLHVSELAQNPQIFPEPSVPHTFEPHPVPEGVLVGCCGIGVFVGGTGVLVGVGVFVGGLGVLVAAGGGVFVRVGVFVGGIGVLVGVEVGATHTLLTHVSAPVQLFPH